MTFKQRVITAIAAAVLAVGWSGAASADRKLIYSAYLQSNHGMLTEAVKPYFDRVAEATKGSLTFDIAAGGALASAKETLSSIRDKVIDSGYVIDVYSPSALPESAMLSGLALLATDPWVLTAAVNETLLLDCEACRERYRRNNIKAIAVSSTSGYLLLCRPLVVSVDDMKGKKIRATSAWAVWASAMGAVPVNIPSSEIYGVIQRGQADCTYGPAAHLQNYTLWDVIENVTNMTTGAFAGGLFLNIRNDVWQDLSDVEKRALIDNAAKAVVDAQLSYSNVDEQARKMSEEKGVKWHAPDADLVAAFKAFQPSEVKRITEEAKARGQVSDPEGIIATFMDNLAKWEGIITKLDRDPAAYEKALQREIFSKLSI